MKCKSNHLYLKMAVLLSGDSKLNPGPVTRHQLKNPKFEAFSNKGLHLIDLIHINPPPPSTLPPLPFPSHCGFLKNVSSKEKVKH